MSPIRMNSFASFVNLMLYFSKGWVKSYCPQNGRYKEYELEHSTKLSHSPECSSLGKQYRLLFLNTKSVLKYLSESSKMHIKNMDFWAHNVLQNQKPSMWKRNGISTIFLGDSYPLKFVILGKRWDRKECHMLEHLGTFYNWHIHVGSLFLF